MSDYTRLTVADFLRFIQGLLPRGLAWTRDAASVQTQVAQALADTAFAQHQNALLLSETESDPNQTYDLLTDFENDYGLPDPCTPLNATVQERRAALLAKMASHGGQSEAYFLGVAGSLGYTITIETFVPFRVGQARVGDRLYSQGWLFVWRIHAPETTLTSFRVGQSTVGEPLRSWGNDPLECVLRRLAPAHTVLQFAYGT